jgi:hypothetical protein
MIIENSSQMSLKSFVESTKAIKRLSKEQEYSIKQIIFGFFRSFEYELQMQKAYEEHAEIIEEDVNRIWKETLIEDVLPF